MCPGTSPRHCVYIYIDCHCLLLLLSYALARVLSGAPERRATRRHRQNNTSIRACGKTGKGSALRSSSNKYAVKESRASRLRGACGGKRFPSSKSVCKPARLHGASSRTRFPSTHSGFCSGWWSVVACPAIADRSKVAGGCASNAGYSGCR